MNCVTGQGALGWDWDEGCDGLGGSSVGLGGGCCIESDRMSGPHAVWE